MTQQIKIGNFTFMLEDLHLPKIAGDTGSIETGMDGEGSGDILDSLKPVHLPRDYIRHHADRSPQEA